MSSDPDAQSGRQLHCEDATIVAVWCILLGIAAASASVRGLCKPQQALLLGVGFIVGCYGFILHEQLSDRPWIANPDPLWAETARLLDVELTTSVSIAKYEPFYSFGPPLAAMLALTLGLVVGSDRNRARQLLLVVGWSGAGYVFYGLVSALIDPAVILWRETQARGGNVTGTFVNRNTAATYFGSCSAIWLPIFSERIRQRLPEGPLQWKHFSQHVLSETHKNTVFAFLALFVCFMALLMTGSRAGVTVSMLTLLAAFTVYPHEAAWRCWLRAQPASRFFWCCFWVARLTSISIHKAFLMKGVSPPITPPCK
jgi:hypothetical protein